MLLRLSLKELSVAKLYKLEKRAFARVQTLRQYGIWPAVIKVAEGVYKLTYDPEPEFGDDSNRRRH